MVFCSVVSGLFGLYAICAFYGPFFEVLFVAQALGASWSESVIVEKISLMRSIFLGSRPKVYPHLLVLCMSFSKKRPNGFVIEEDLISLFYSDLMFS